MGRSQAAGAPQPSWLKGRPLTSTTGASAPSGKVIKMIKRSFLMATVAIASLAAANNAAHARDQIQVAGSSTVLPYAQIVAEEFG